MRLARRGKIRRGYPPEFEGADASKQDLLLGVMIGFEEVRVGEGCKHWHTCVGEGGEEKGWYLLKFLDGGRK